MEEKHINEHGKKLALKEKIFFEALKEDDTKTVVSLLSSKPFKNFMQARDKLTLAFMQVVLLNNVNLLKVLVTNGLDICVTDSMFEENGVIHAARYGHTGMIQYLLDNGVPINHQAENGATALHVSVENKQYDALQLLVEQRQVDLNIQDRNGYTALAWAARLRDERSIQVLLEAGSSCETRTFFRRIAPLHICVDPEEALWKAKYAPPDLVCRCIRLLADAGADINSCDLNGNSPLVHAIERNNIPAIKFLLKLHCDLKCFGTAQMEMQLHSSVQIVPVLVPLYLAMNKLQLRTVQILCAAGAPYHKLCTDSELWTRLQINCPHLHDWLYNQVCSVTPLKQQCRRVICNSIEGEVAKVAKELDLPLSLQRFVSLQDLDDI